MMMLKKKEEWSSTVVYNEGIAQHFHAHIIAHDKLILKYQQNLDVKTVYPKIIWRNYIIELHHILKFDGLTVNPAYKNEYD